MTAEDFILQLPEPIAVVGNGMIRNQREEIELHATIIRINNFAATGFEPHVGHRINAWCINCHDDLKPKNWGCPVFTVVHPNDQPANVKRWLEKYPNMHVPKEQWTLAARVFKAQNPSTGLTLLHRLLLLRMKFTAFGFDGLRSGHYWDATHIHSHGDEFGALMELSRLGVAFR